MVKGIASAGVVGIVWMMAAGGAVCQSGLPDAPSARVAVQSQRFDNFPLNFAGTNMGAMSAPGWPMRQNALLFDDRAAANHASNQKDPEAVFRKYLSRTPTGQQASNWAAGGSLMGRATHAAARTVITRNQAGKGKLNTSYLLRALTAVAKDSASTPYWRRHLSATV